MTSGCATWNPSAACRTILRSTVRTTFQRRADTTLPDIERCAGNVAAIREMCSEAGTELTVILTPFCREQIEQYDNAALNAFYQALSDVTDYWNFSITPLTYDERFFYDVTHTRNAAANLVLARIAGDESVGLPDAFGAYCRQGESTDAAQLKKAAGESAYLQNGRRDRPCSCCITISTRISRKARPPCTPRRLSGRCAC